MVIHKTARTSSRIYESGVAPATLPTRLVADVESKVPMGRHTSIIQHQGGSSFGQGVTLWASSESIHSQSDSAAVKHDNKSRAGVSARTVKLVSRVDSDAPVGTLRKAWPPYGSNIVKTPHAIGEEQK